MAEAKKSKKKSEEVEVTPEVVETPVVETTPEVVEAEATEAKEESKTKTAKAGKRSAKGQQEAEAKVEKVEHQKKRDEDDSEDDKPKQKQNPTRTVLERRAKGYRKSNEQIDKTKSYTLAEAMKLVVKTSHVKFDAGTELHVRLGVDPRQADQNLRDTIVLPAGTGKNVRVAVFADVDDVKAAKAAGADIAASEEFLQQLDKGVINFDILIATPAMMPKLGKFARVLGPKGLMPNPKSGTVATDVAKAVKEAKAGRVEYRVDSTGIVHVGVGKVSFGADKLMENTRAVLNSLKANKPASVKGTYVKSIFIATTMGPSIKVENSEL